MRRERIIASLLGLLLLTGCSPSTWKAYAGEKLPADQTALIREGGSPIQLWRFDGQEIPSGFALDPMGQILQEFTTHASAAPIRLHAIRALPGTHDVEVVKWVETGGGRGRFDHKHVTIDAEAGEAYTIDWHIVNGVHYIWVEDKSGSLVWGEKPPAE